MGRLCFLLADQDSMACVDMVTGAGGGAATAATSDAGGRDRLDSCDMEAAAEDIVEDMRLSSLSEEQMAESAGAGAAGGTQ